VLRGGASQGRPTKWTTAVPSDAVATALAARAFLSLREKLHSCFLERSRQQEATPSFAYCSLNLFNVVEIAKIGNNKPIISIAIQRLSIHTAIASTTCSSNRTAITAVTDVSTRGQKLHSGGGLPQPPTDASARQTRTHTTPWRPSHRPDRGAHLGYDPFPMTSCKTCP
jgi:hypothetical protein